MRILKFGGSSVSTPERIKNVINILKDKYDQDPSFSVVFSAFGGVTDALISISKQAAAGNEQYHDALEHLIERHLAAAENLISGSNLSLVIDTLKEYFKELSDALHGVQLIRELSPRSLDLIMSFGERMSAYIISEAMKPAIPGSSFLDARELVKTDRNFGNARVNYETTFANIISYFSGKTFVPIITGFIGSTDDQVTTTLGRGGSDYTAAIFGAALKVQEIEIWTDVDGVMTADPRKVQQAFPIAAMSYKEALEMSHFGAKVIHPPTIAPALQRNIPIWIKNSFHPTAPGTFISKDKKDHGSLICGISSIDDIALLRLEGSGLVGVCGTAMRLFGALAKNGINVILITQGSSEHSICFGIAPIHAEQARTAIDEEFLLERKAGLIDNVIVEKGLSVIAVVGENMRMTPGLAGRLFGALGKNGVNVVAMVQGSSEYNISVVIKREDEEKGLNVIHEDFFLSHITTLHIFLVGTGLIGSTLLSQMEKQLPILRKEHSLDIRIVGLANSQKMYFEPHGLKVTDHKELLRNSSEKMDIASYIKKMKSLNLMNSIFVDCTSSEEIAENYSSILSSSISIVTPNKKANSGSYSRYKKLKELSELKGIKFYYQTNVGGGLPIISTIIDLRRSGDKIVKIEAILSGTLSYLFNTFTAGTKFSEVLREAQKKGYTEPDPREDLNGKDVLRKLLILVRESGFPMEIEDITIEPIVPEECFAGKGVDEFYHKLKDYDSMLEQKRSQAAKEGKVLRFIATFKQGKASVALQAVNASHPFYHLSGSDNIIALNTERYRDTPLVIKGQGAGAEVTAGEVFADIIRFASH